METEIFYQRVIENAAQPPLQRHRLFTQLHSEVVAAYLKAIHKLTPDKADRIVATGSDARTVAQVVGHIAAWEQFSILAGGDMLAGVQHPRMATTVEGYIATDGQIMNFPGIDAFNAYHAGQHANWSWERIQALAIDTATTLQVLFSHPALLSADRLEQTKLFRKRLQNGFIIDNIAMGWNVWITALEHEAIEHAVDLDIGQ